MIAFIGGAGQHQRGLSRPKLGSRLAQPGFQVGRVQAQQHLAFGHTVIEVGFPLQHRAADLGAYVDSDDGLQGASGQHHLRDGTLVNGGGAEFWGLWFVGPLAVPVTSTA